jgi:thymidylate synthase
MENNFETKLLVCEGEGPNDLYFDLVKGLQDMGSIQKSRGLETIEIRPAMVIFTDPTKRFLTCPGRLIHPYFQVMESIWILAGRGDVAWISKYLKNIEKYSDGQLEFHAPYGYRMRKYGYHRDPYLMEYSGHEFDQFENCLKYLQSDPNTRHAVMTFWNPDFDQFGIETIDRPCNITFHFLVRDGKLDLTIFNRSNDLHWGLMNANVVQFSVILETAAMILGIPVGNQIHMIDSLHYYTDNPITENVQSKEYDFNVYDYVSPLPFIFNDGGYFYTMHSANDDNLTDHLDDELKTFFKAEENIWKTGQPSTNSLDHSLLQDALSLAFSFYHYKRHNYEIAINALERVQADDIFISCLEFLNRVKFPGTDLAQKVLIEFLIYSRFKNSLSKFQIKEISKYINNH